MGPSEIASWASLIFRAGLAVYEAIEAGDHTRTVGEIFEGLKSDQSEIDRLDAIAREKLGLA